jgi:hypothetical protein
MWQFFVVELELPPPCGIVKREGDAKSCIHLVQMREITVLLVLRYRQIFCLINHVIYNNAYQDGYEL